MPHGVNAELATCVSAFSSMIYAIIAGVSLLLLRRQISDARRFGAAPALYALLKELDEHLAAIQQVDEMTVDDPASRDTIVRCLEFYERIEHLRRAGVVQAAVLRSAFGNALRAHLHDPRFVDIIRQAPHQYDELTSLAASVCTPERRLPEIRI